MKNNSLIFLLILMFIITSCEPGSDRPNIILMMADDLCWGDTGLNDNTVISTPEMDRLAEIGMIFTRFY